jgi:hypothetical protein
MKIKATLGQISILCESDFFKKLHEITSTNIYAIYKLRKILQSLGKANEDIQKGRLLIFQKYGKKVLDKNGHETGNISIQQTISENATEEEAKAIKENFENFAKDNAEYLNNEDSFEIPCFLDMKTLESLELKISPIDLILLEPILDKNKIEKYLAEQETAAEKK